MEKVQEAINKAMDFAPPPRNDKAPEGETFKEKLVRKVSAEPLVPIGAIITVGFLSMGLRAFNRGNALEAQKLMRGRVLAQFFTVSIMIAGAYAGFKPGGERPKSYEEKLSLDQDKQSKAGESRN